MVTQNHVDFAITFTRIVNRLAKICQSMLFFIASLLLFFSFIQWYLLPKGLPKSSYSIKTKELKRSPLRCLNWKIFDSESKLV